LRTARAAARLLGVALLSFCAWIAVHAGLAVFAFAPRRRGRWQGRVFHAWSAALMPLLGVRVDWQGPVPATPFLLVSNHLSYLDIMILGSRLPATFIAKAEVARWPVVGHLCKMVDTIFVDRARKTDLRRVLEHARGELDRGRGIVFFPEGTTSSGAGLLPFRASLLDLPASLGMPVWAAAIRYQTASGDPPAQDSVCWWGEAPFSPHLWKMLGLRGIRASVRVAPQPIAAAERKQLAALLQQAVADRFTPVIAGVAPEDAPLPASRRR
jgi:1-acyl-sn-glycerol-3-phosphate acyltransferase